VDARQKLNAAYFNGSLFLAAVLGWLAESWAVSFLAFGAALVLNLRQGEIRLRPTCPRQASTFRRPFRKEGGENES
jgi:hypothetical protein